MATNSAKRSLVHDYFDRTDNVALCKICKIEVKTPSSNTSNMRQHLRSKHISSYDEMVAKEELASKKVRRTTKKL